ncbi:hypothetical protein [Planococcus alpniumensis]|uniref:hypothetical protein n=1 Tax=Planococcus alpniumensis TaxID=2708345 RepID=UPI001B8D6B15|nr:hypothetical protein [Planococcus sp. MSAK28401]
MVETIVTSSLNAIREKSQSSDGVKAPQELIDFIEKHPYSKVDGYIYGNKSAKIISEEGESAGPTVHSYFHSFVNSLEQKGDEETMNNQNSTDTLFKELKIDMREREERSRKEISDREERYERQLERFAQESQQREERIRQETKEREERIEKMINGVNSKVEDHAKYFESIKTQNFWGNITVFVALVAILVTLMLALFNQ